MTRECTTQLLEMIEEGLLDPAPLLARCLGWIGEEEVRTMCAAHGIEWQASGEEEPDELDPIPDADYADCAAADYAARVTSGGDR
jgi:hypothetical protein